MTSTTCPHVPDEVAVAPSSRGCSACEASGSSWVNLRMCLACGEVACCDSSPNRHATRHHEATGHPVIRSVEPGERWRWCYVDGMFV